MSGSEAAEAVQRLKGDLERAQGELAAVRGRAEEAAAALRHDPSRERQAERDLAASDAELLDLGIAKLRGQLSEAEAVAREEAIGALLAGHAETVQAVAQAADERLHEHLDGIEEALGAMTGARNRTRSVTGQLMALGYDGHTPQIAVRPDRDVARRLERLADAYARCMRPVMTG